MDSYYSRYPNMNTRSSFNGTSNFPYQSRYDAFQSNRVFQHDNSVAQSMLNSRLEKLKNERDRLRNFRTTPQPPSVSNLYSYGNFSQLGHQIMNPYFYSYKFLDPVYYPLEIPGTGRPVQPPRMEMGGPVDEKEHCCCNGVGGMSAADLLVVLKAMGKIPPIDKPVLNTLLQKK